MKYSEIIKIIQDMGFEVNGDASRPHIIHVGIKQDVIFNVTDLCNLPKERIQEIMAFNSFYGFHNAIEGKLNENA